LPQAGITLIELLVVITLLGSSIAAVTGAVFTATRASHRTQTRTQMSAFLQLWADRTLAPTTSSGAWNYSPCAAPPSGIPLASERPDGWVVTWDVTYLSTTPPIDWGNPTFTTAAPSSPCTVTKETDPVTLAEVDRDGGLQRIRLRVRSGADVTAPGYVADTLTIYKRDPRCSPQYANADRGPC